MEPRISTLTIERFRAFRNLKITGLGRVNLITGLNNSGKSSVLEALRILASSASPAVISDILHSREEDKKDRDESSYSLSAEGDFPFSSLFHGFPKLTTELQPILISSSNGHNSNQLSLDVGWFSEHRDKDGQRRLIPRQTELFDEGEAVPMLVIERNGIPRLLPFDYPRRYPYRNMLVGLDLLEGGGYACEYVSPYIGERTANLGSLWDNIVLSDLEEDVIAALRIIDNDIVAVSMVGGEKQRETRTAIVRSISIPHPIPLRSFGDGLNRLFGIVLSLVNAKDGLLLIDEFENGLHHTIQADAWRTVFKIASRLNIQVMATSHSWDSIEAFQKAASELPEDGVLIRLSRKGEDIISTVFSEDELAIATRERIEVR
ncbi:MAG: AAA family ATPase [bacterium]|nr:AAA family ATPase [bacterium]